MKKAYVSPEINKIELDENNAVSMVVNSKAGDFPVTPALSGAVFDQAAFPCLEEIVPGTSLNTLGGGPVSNSMKINGGIQVKNNGAGAGIEFTIVDS